MSLLYSDLILATVQDHTAVTTYVGTVATYIGFNKSITSSHWHLSVYSEGLSSWSTFACIP